MSNWKDKLDKPVQEFIDALDKLEEAELVKDEDISIIIDYNKTKNKDMNGEKVSSAWSKEDDELITAAICFIDSYNHDNGFACNGIYKADVSKWLKSLKQRIKE